MESLPAERKALLFASGGVGLALRLSQVQEILPLPAGEGVGHVEVRGEQVPALSATVPLGLPPCQERFALLTAGQPALALKVESLQGIVDLSAVEVFQLPLRTPLPEPAPFVAVLVHQGAVALEVAVSALGWVPIQPAPELRRPPPDLGFPSPREVLFTRAGQVYAVPVQLLARVLERPLIFPVPLTPAVHRGLLYHERAIHPVLDLEVLHGGSPAGPGAFALLVEAGSSAVAVMADGILPAGTFGDEPRRPSWEGLFEEPR